MKEFKYQTNINDGYGIGVPKEYLTRAISIPTFNLVKEYHDNIINSYKKREQLLHNKLYTEIGLKKEIRKIKKNIKYAKYYIEKKHLYEQLKKYQVKLKKLKNKENNYNE